MNADTFKKANEKFDSKRKADGTINKFLSLAYRICIYTHISAMTDYDLPKHF